MLINSKALLKWASSPAPCLQKPKALLKWASRPAPCLQNPKALLVWAGSPAPCLKNPKAFLIRASSPAPCLQLFLVPYNAGITDAMVASSPHLAICGGTSVRIQIFLLILSATFVAERSPERERGMNMLRPSVAASSFNCRGVQNVVIFPVCFTFILLSFDFDWKWFCAIVLSLFQSRGKLRAANWWVQRLCLIDWCDNYLSDATYAQRLREFGTKVRTLKCDGQERGDITAICIMKECDGIVDTGLFFFY